MRFFVTITLISFYLVCVSAFTNPIKPRNGADPFMVYSDGYYYLMTTSGKDLQITRATSLEKIKTAKPKVVWNDDNPNRCCNVWAPELHKMDGDWYIYYTAGTEKNTPHNQRMHAIKGNSSDIWASAWSYAG
ncbi:hypothetical protein FS749_006138 [Ceratobasidium sp. UAMH 11750]|nr:hypothetical protein FS749_006138 [Ceratobasidium sp. UAMH 11750]